MVKQLNTEIDVNSEIRSLECLNPEASETRCKICFEQANPLVSLCECTGSIAYVHQDCILDWIAIKMERSELIQIPKCQICHSRYSATMKMGSKKIDNKLLWQKIKKIPLKDIAYSVFYAVGTIISIIMIISTIINTFKGSLINTQSILTILMSALMQTFVGIVFPMLFIQMSKTFFKKKLTIVDQCRVQLVEVTLMPKRIVKS